MYPQTYLSQMGKCCISTTGGLTFTLVLLYSFHVVDKSSWPEKSNTFFWLDNFANLCIMDFVELIKEKNVYIKRIYAWNLQSW